MNRGAWQATVRGVMKELDTAERLSTAQGKCTQKNMVKGLPWWLSGRESACRSRRQGFDPWSRKIPRALRQLSPCATTAELVV